MKSCVIIGAGIVGLSTAWFLREAGWEVTVLEKDDLSDNCSFGNMGYLSPSHFVPLAAPGMVSKGLWWMFSVKSPFYVRPLPRFDLMDWGLKFMAHATEAHVRRSIPHLHNILMFSRDLTAEWQRSGALSFDYVQQGCLMYYKTAATEKEELENAHMAQDLGLSVEVLSREAIQALEPEVRPDVRGGVWFKDDAHLHPNTLMRQLAEALAQRGVAILRNTPLTRVERAQGRIQAVFSGEKRFEADLFVLAAGSWSPQLAKQMGEYVPLMPGKGYSMTVSNPQVALRYPCILLEAKVALTPWAKQLRIGSTMEIGPINDRILFPRVQGILEAVPKFLPGYLDDPVFRELADFNTLRAQLREKVWFGFRPVSADGMPYIGWAKHNNNLMVATGHSMLGLSMGAGTGKLLAEMAEGQATSISVEAFDPGRV